MSEIGVEKIVHEVLRKAVQEIANSYNICVLEVKFDWRDTSTHDKPIRQIERIWLQTVTQY